MATPLKPDPKDRPVRDCERCTMHGKFAITGLLALALVATAVPVEADSEKAFQEYTGSNQFAGVAFCSLTGENVGSVCFDIPEGARSVTITITDEHSANQVMISARILVDTGEVMDTGRECGQVGFDDIPHGATEIFVWIYGTTDTVLGGCHGAGGTTGTVQASFAA